MWLHGGRDCLIRQEDRRENIHLQNIWVKSRCRNWLTAQSDKKEE